jgi:hypothetical protein
MGLDGVELLLAVEDAFQIHIEDHEAGGVYTVGDLYNLVVTKLQGQDSKRCLTSAAFYRTRRGIMDTLGVDRLDRTTVLPWARHWRFANTVVTTACRCLSVSRRNSR